MSRDLPLESTEPWDDDIEERSLLDCSIELPVALGRWIVGTIAVVLAVLLRLPGLDRWPFTVSEADLSLTAHRLIRGEAVPDSLHGAPFAVEWTGLFIFSGGATDATVRIATAVAGISAVLALLALARWVGARPAVAAALLAAASPTMIATSRRVDGGALLVALSVAVIAAGLVLRNRDGIGWPAVAGAAAALLVLSGPLGIPALALCLLAIRQLQRERITDGSRDATIATIAAFAGTLALSASVFLTRPASFSASLAGLLERLWNDHLTDMGSGSWLPAFNLILNEPLLLVLSAVAWLAPGRREIVSALTTWFAFAFVLFSLLGNVGDQGYALMTLPLVLLAGVGAAHFVERTPWLDFRRGPAIVYVGAILLLVAALVSLLGLLTSSGTARDGEWLLRFALVVLVGLLPLSLIISSVGARVVGDRLVLVLLAALVLLSTLTIRSAVLSASERPGQPGDPLAAGATGADITVIVGRLQRLSRDMTMSVRSSQDPTGGHGLRIAIDSAIAQPFQWYFRDYPNATVFDPNTGAPPIGTEIILLRGDRDSRAVAPGYVGQTYRYAPGTPAAFDDPDWGGMVTGIVSPNDWRRFANFLIDRTPSTTPVDQHFQLLATGDIAQRLFPAAGPFTLDDRPGPGSGQGQFNRPRGIAIAPDGTTYVVDARNSRVQVFNQAGEVIDSFGSDGTGPGQLARFATAGGGGPNGIAIGDDGNIYVADTWNHRIQVFAPDGQYLRGWGRFFDAQDDPAASATNPGLFYGPRGLAFHDGLVYVTDTGNERVQVFQTDGTPVRMFGLPGSGDGQLTEPVGIAVTSDGTVLVADSHNARIARFATDGQWQMPWQMPSWTGLRFFEPYLAVGPDGTVYASTSSQQAVYAIGPEGTVGLSLGTESLRQPFGVAVWPDGSSLLVTDGDLSAVVRVPIPPR